MKRAYSDPSNRIRPTNPFIKFNKEDIEKTIPHRFEQIVARYGDRLAVKTGSGAATYSEINARANQIAREILTRSETGDLPVALLLEMGPTLIAAMLGVLKAGKFFVLLDRLSPQARISGILDNSQAGLTICDRETATLARGVVGDHDRLLECEAIDNDSPSENLNLSMSPSATALIVYTSGSTGQPKGVIWNHRNLLHNTMLQTNVYHVSDQDRLCVLTLGTANTVLNALVSLLNGAVLLPYKAQSEGGNRLAAWLSREAITICPIGAPLFRSVASTLTGKETFTNLRMLRLTSASVQRTDVELYKKFFPATCLLAIGLNSSETGLSRIYFLDHDSDFATSELPVGYEVEDKSILLLDGEGREVELSQVGEIVVRSPYLAIGYWRNPDLTETMFKPGREGGECLYHSGDLGFMLEDGLLLYKGRKDFRVNIRGYGVEIGEVETSLLTHQAIKDVVVVTVQQPDGDTRLVAYYTVKNYPAPTVSELRNYLHTRLPEYMTPSSFVLMKSLPLTSNGKIDRTSLPAAARARPDLDNLYVPPKNSIQEDLARFWEQILDKRPIGIRDNFFDLGGHSLLAVRLFAQIEKTFGNQLRPATLFEAPTIEQLASILKGADGAASWSALVPIQPNGSNPPFFWVHGDASSAFLPKYLDADQPIFGLEHQSQDGKPALYRKVETIAAHYLKEIRMVQPKGPYFLGGYSFGGTVAFEIAQQLKHQKEEVALLILLDSGFPGLRDILAQRDAYSAENRIIGETLSGILRRHWQTLSPLGVSAKIQYVTRGLLGRLNERTQGIRKVLRKTICGVNIALGLPIPRSLRSDYILDIYDDHARRTYVPLRYDGKVFYVKSEQRLRDHSEKWREVIAGEMESYEVPGGHSDIRQEPSVGLWAGAVQARLAESQMAVGKAKRE